MQPKKVFITGGSGFIGSHVVEKFLDEGSEVTCLVEYNSHGSIGNLSHLPKEKLDRVKIVHGNIHDTEHLKEYMKDHDTIIHLAALIAIPYSYENPRAYIRTNVEGSLNVFQAALEVGAKKVIHTSTSEVYGTPHTVPIKETFPLQGQSPYSASKIAADKVAESYFNSFDLPLVIARPFNNYGPRQSARAFIPTVILQALYGDKIMHGSLHPTRDYLYAEDTADAYFTLAKASNVNGKTVNLGTSKEWSMGDILKTIVALSGRDVQLVEDPARIRPNKSEVLRLNANIDLMTELTGWKPKVSFEEGLRKTMEWYKLNRTYSDVNRYHK
jgi:NAD dependent epimerase/dehydratase